MIEQGFTTIKIKVGKDVNLDLKKISIIQSHLDGRAKIRIDANRGYTKEQGCEFVAGLKPNYIELFEQPCNANNWEANAAVAKLSSIPIMLDEPICGIKDIEKASRIEGVRLCKLKLKFMKMGCRRIRKKGEKKIRRNLEKLGFRMGRQMVLSIKHPVRLS